MNNYKELTNIHSPFSISYWKSFKHISKCKLDKVIIEKKTNKVKKVEVYNYFNNDNVEKIIKYLLSPSFEFTKNKSKFNKLRNVLLMQEWKNIVKNGRIVDIEIRKYKYYYYVYFVRVLVHRKRPFLLKIYWNQSQNKDFVKLEITYSLQKKLYNLHFLDWINAMKSINEIIKKIEKKFTPIWYDEDFSKKITLDSFIFQMMSKLGKSQVNHINNIFTKLTGKVYKND